MLFTNNMLLEWQRARKRFLTFIRLVGMSPFLFALISSFQYGRYPRLSCIHSTPTLQKIIINSVGQCRVQGVGCRAYKLFHQTDPLCLFRFDSSGSKGSHFPLCTHLQRLRAIAISKTKGKSYQPPYYLIDQFLGQKIINSHILQLSRLSHCLKETYRRLLHSIC